MLDSFACIDTWRHKLRFVIVTVIILLEIHSSNLGYISNVKFKFLAVLLQLAYKTSKFRVKQNETNLNKTNFILRN